MGKWIVAKFGGSSVKDGTSMLRCARIIKDNPLIKIVVISATQFTTNHLELIASSALAGDRDLLERELTELKSKHLKIATELFISTDGLKKLELLSSELKMKGLSILEKKSFGPMDMDELYSFGERMSSLLFSDLLDLSIPDKKIFLLDAREMIKTDSQFLKASPLIDLIALKVREKIPLGLLDDEKSLFVTQGFIGSDLEGKTTTLGREGSDYSATLLGEAIDASLVQIWTDVPAIMSCDPHFVPNAYYLEKLSYDEATALATNGAKILFPTTLLPAKRKNIPVFVGSSLNPNLGGTKITNSIQGEELPKLKAVALQDKEGIKIVTYIGSAVDTNNEFRVLIEKACPGFEFMEATSVAIRFKVLDANFDSSTLLKMAHKILESNGTI